MFDRNQQRFSKPLLWLLRAIGVIVPRWLRVDWRQGWEAEFGLAPSCVAESSLSGQSAVSWPNFSSRSVSKGPGRICSEN